MNSGQSELSDNVPAAIGNYQLTEEDEALLEEITRFGRKYTVDQKIQAATYYTISGNYQDVGRKTGIDPEAVRWWAKKQWWKDLVKIIRLGKQDELDAKITDIIHLGVGQLKDRVEHGNIRINQVTGEEYRAPMTSTELARDALGIPYDKRALLRGDPTSRTERIGAEDNLRLLAEQFVKMVKEREPKPIEGEVIEDVK